MRNLVNKLITCLLFASSAVALVPASAAAPTSNKELVLTFFRMMFQERNVEEALRLYVSKDYVQHNPYMADGVGPLFDFFPGYFEQHPQASVEIKRVIAEGELVVIYNLWKDSPEDRGQAIVDIFRVKDGKIVEHWDVSQDIPENPANQNTMF